MIEGALSALDHALSLAAPEGYVRTFVDEGAPMADLLAQAVARASEGDYASKLLAAFETGRADGDTSSPRPLIEPLSKRELEVLTLLGSDLSGPEIARELMIALTTLRFHTRNIYGKLHVNSRRSAVRRAQELDLI